MARHHGRLGPRTRLPRILAALAGLALAASAAVAFALSYALLRLADAGESEAAEAARTGSEMLAAEAGDQRVASVAMGGFDRLADALIGGVTLHARQFQWLTVAVMAAGLILVVSAIRSRPTHAWPEWLWLLAAATALLPAVIFHPWLFVATPLAALTASAAAVHFLRRRDYTLGRAATAAQAWQSDRIRPG